jgi:hypothetical protein
MKYMKKLNIWKASNVTFNPKSIDAHSYKHWRFVALVDGLVVFNNYRYSVTTAKHQRVVENLLAHLGIKIDMKIQIPTGIRTQTIEELILEAEETECEEILRNEEKKDIRNEKAAFRRKAKKLEDILENEKHFRDCNMLSSS